MEDYGTYNISTFLPPAAPLKVNLNMGWEYVRIINNSPYLLNINFGQGFNLTLPEMYLEDIKIPERGPVWITITPSINLTNITQSLSYSISINAFSKGELTNPQAQPLTQQAVNVTASGQPIYSANADFPNTATAGQSLNIFNPALSGTIIHFFQIIAYTNDSAFPGANVLNSRGSDNNYASPVNIIPHVSASVIPTSVAHATSQDNATTPPGVANEVIRCQQSAPNNIPLFPDGLDLYPGGNITLFLAGSASGKITHLTMKWVEIVVIPPVPVTGATAVASSIDNEGNPIGTSIIKSGITGVGTPIQIFNDGSSSWSVDASGVLHKVITTNLSGNFLQLGQAGDFTEVLSQLQTDQNVTFIVGGNTIGGVDSTGVKITGAGTAFRMLAGSLSRVVTVGDTTIANAGTSVSHSLGVVPDFVIPVHDLGAANADVIGINFGTMSASNFTAYSSNAGGSGNVRFIVIKLAG